MLQEDHKSETIQRVPLLDLKAQYATIKEEIDEAIHRVLDSQYFILGPEVESLEKEFAQYCGCRCAIGVSSGTDALLVSLMAVGVSHGDEVITTPFTFFATVGCILRLGARPIFADIDLETYNINPDKVRKLVTFGTKAVIPVHLFGQCADMAPLLELAEEHDMAIIEDAAQAVGAEYKGRRAGNMGTLGCFSFFPSKNLGAYGEAGMITTNDEELADRVRILRHQGNQPKYHHKVLGGNFRLDAIQAAVLGVKLKYLDSWTEKRSRNAAYYSKLFQDIGLAEKKVFPPAVAYGSHIFNYYVIRADDRDGLRKHLDAAGVGTEVYYPVPMHLQECINSGQYAKGDFPLSEEASRSVLALPIYPELGQRQQEYVVAKIAEYYRNS